MAAYYTTNSELNMDTTDSGELLIYDPQTNKTHILNMTATALLRLCCGNTFDEIKNNYLELFDFEDEEDVTAAKAIADAQKMLDQFIEQNLIFVVDDK